MADILASLQYSVAKLLLEKEKGIANISVDVVRKALQKKGPAKAGILLPPPKTLLATGSTLLAPLADSKSTMSKALEASLARNPKIKELFTKGMAKAKNDVEKLFVKNIALRNLNKTPFLAAMDFQNTRARSLLDDAIHSLPDVTLRELLTSLSKQEMRGNLEQFSEQLTRHLSKEDAPRFLRAVHERLCLQMKQQLDAALADSPLRAPLTQLYDGLLNTAEPRLAAHFRSKLKVLLSEDRSSEILQQVLHQLDGTARERFVQFTLNHLLNHPSAQRIFAQHIDQNGMLKLLSSFASFRKVYTAQRMLKAMESLNGWILEASQFTVRLALTETETFAKSLTTELSNLPQIKVGAALLHHDVLAPSLSSAKSIKQATDILGTVPLSSTLAGAKPKTVHVIGLALESKGEQGVLSGIKQAGENLRRRYKNGNKVPTEHGTFTMGEDLFLSLEDALVALGTQKNTARSVAVAVRGDKKNTWRALVVSPLEQATAMGKHTAQLEKAGVQYVQHPMSREELVRASSALAPHVGLMPLLK